ncbi:hypothetical protein B6U80_02515 [Candidatus Pacearchaeota archaeon ex4484_26]|nr:MAG: hypothetical protein B6U80_02515 [Candidatus Pacearchaeota archaeon ex4484_26]
MDEIKYEIKKKYDEYVATADLPNGGGSIIVGAEDYASLKEKIPDLTQEHLEFCRENNIPVPKNPKISLSYNELLFENPDAERILILATQKNGGYRAGTNTLLSLDLYHESFDVLREELIKEIQQQGHQDKQVEFRLEEVLD